MARWVKGQSGNLNGRPKAEASIDAEVRRQLTPSITAKLVRQAVKDATTTSTSLAAQGKRQTARAWLAERLEGKPMAPAQVAMVMAQHQRPMIAPWNDDAAGAVYVNPGNTVERDALPGDALPQLPDAGLPDADGLGFEGGLDTRDTRDTRDAAPEHPRVSLSAVHQGNGTRRENEQTAEQAGMADFLARFDPDGTAYNAYRASQGLAPEAPPWHQHPDEWAQSRTSDPTVAFGQPGRSQDMDDGYGTSEALLRRAGIVPERVDGQSEAQSQAARTLARRSRQSA